MTYMDKEFARFHAVEVPEVDEALLLQLLHRVRYQHAPLHLVQLFTGSQHLIADCKVLYKGKAYIISPL